MIFAFFSIASPNAKQTPSLGRNKESATSFYAHVTVRRRHSWPLRLIRLVEAPMAHRSKPNVNCRGLGAPVTLLVQWTKVDEGSCLMQALDACGPTRFTSGPRRLSAGQCDGGRSWGTRSHSLRTH